MDEIDMAGALGNCEYKLETALDRVVELEKAAAVAFAFKERMVSAEARVEVLEDHADDVEESQSLAARERDDALARVAVLEQEKEAIKVLAAKAVQSGTARVEVLEAEANGPWLAADKTPDDDQYSVEVYGRSMGKDYKQLVWTSWGAQYLEPWYVWRYHDIPCKSLRDKSSRQRRKHGAVALKGNGHYMKPVKSGEGES